MNRESTNERILSPGDPILITGAAGFIGRFVVKGLLDRGFENIRCLVRDSGRAAGLSESAEEWGGQSRVKITIGNLLSREDCAALASNAILIYHLAAGTGSKSFSEAYLNSVVTTRNLLEATLGQRVLRRFVNISSFAVYTNRKKPKWRLLDESCPVETHPESRAEAYCYGKVKQDELLAEYAKKAGIPYVIMRPGTAFGPGKIAIPGRVGSDSFGFFLHMGGSNPLPLTYVENCAEAIVLAGLVPGINGNIFNIVDDDLPTSRYFLRLYKKNVKRFPTFYLPHWASYLMYFLWEKYSKWSNGQLPPVYTRREWSVYRKKTYFSNEKIKDTLGWSPRVPMKNALELFFESSR